MGRYSHYDHFTYIDQYGIALDDYGNEYRDNNGQIFIVPKYKRKFYTVIERG